MERRPTILLVTRTRAVAEAFVQCLCPDRYRVLAVSTFARAKSHLDLRPSLLVTEIRLGEYNGLHLALRARARGVAAIVVGEPDPVVQADAQNFGATFLRSSDLVRERVTAAVECLLEAGPPYLGTTASRWLEYSQCPQPLPGGSWRLLADASLRDN